MLGPSQARLSREILLLGFLYVHSSFPWTAPSSSGAQAPGGARPPPPAGCCNRTPVSLETSAGLCPTLN